MLDYIADEAVQIHGGMGYSAEMDVDRGYRDSRINRIFEGTNEINRILVVDTAMKRAMKGEFPLFTEAEKVYSSAATINDGKIAGETYFSEKMRYIRNFKKAIMICMHGAVKKFDKSLVHEQEVLNNIADIMMETYMSESLLLRVEKREALKESATVYRDILDVNIFDTAELVRKSAYEAIYSFAAPEAEKDLVKAIDVLTSVEGVNVKEARRRIAGKLIEDKGYRF
jgi:alkylation response protein AidB-like acyl-CoA dehydrogenase